MAEIETSEELLIDQDGSGSGAELVSDFDHDRSAETHGRDLEQKSAEGASVIDTNQPSTEFLERYKDYQGEWSKTYDSSTDSEGIRFYNPETKQLEGLGSNGEVFSITALIEKDPHHLPEHKEILNGWETAAQQVQFREYKESKNGQEVLHVTELRLTAENQEVSVTWSLVLPETEPVDASDHESVAVQDAGDSEEPLPLRSSVEFTVGAIAEPQSAKTGEVLQTPVATELSSDSDTKDDDDASESSATTIVQEVSKPEAPEATYNHPIVQEIPEVQIEENIKIVERVAEPVASLVEPGDSFVPEISDQFDADPDPVVQELSSEIIATVKDSGDADDAPEIFLAPEQATAIAAPVAITEHGSQAVLNDSKNLEILLPAELGPAPETDSQDDPVELSGISMVLPREVARETAAEPAKQIVVLPEVGRSEALVSEPNVISLQLQEEIETGEILAAVDDIEEVTERVGSEISEVQEVGQPAATETAELEIFIPDIAVSQAVVYETDLETGHIQESSASEFESQTLIAIDDLEDTPEILESVAILSPEALTPVTAETSADRIVVQETVQAETLPVQFNLQTEHISAIFTAELESTPLAEADDVEEISARVESVESGITLVQEVVAIPVPEAFETLGPEIIVPEIVASEVLVSEPVIISEPQEHEVFIEVADEALDNVAPVVENTERVVVSQTQTEVIAEQPKIIVSENIEPVFQDKIVPSGITAIIEPIRSQDRQVLVETERPVMENTERVERVAEPVPQEIFSGIRAVVESALEIRTGQAEVPDDFETEITEILHLDKHEITASNGISIVIEKQVDMETDNASGEPEHKIQKSTERITHKESIFNISLFAPGSGNGFTTFEPNYKIVEKTPQPSIAPSLEILEKQGAREPYTIHAEQKSTLEVEEDQGIYIATPKAQEPRHDHVDFVPKEVFERRARVAAKVAQTENRTVEAGGTSISQTEIKIARISRDDAVPGSVLGFEPREHDSIVSILRGNGAEIKSVQGRRFNGQSVIQSEVDDFEQPAREAIRLVEYSTAA